MSSWLDLCGDDSNLSMTSVDYTKELNNVPKATITHDPEFGSSRQGFNLLFKTNVKIIDIEHSQSRKRKIHEVDNVCKENDNKGVYLPPKAKQRTNIRGDWKQRKNECDFSHFLKVLAHGCNLQQSKEKDKEHTDAIRVRTPNSKRRRITPILENVIFNSDLILNKVPILTKSDPTAEVLHQYLVDAPIFLNADQIKSDYTSEHGNDTKEKKVAQEKNNCCNSSFSVWNCSKKKANKNSWASTLFSSEIEKNRITCEETEYMLVGKQKKNRLLQIKIASILPVQVDRECPLSTKSPNVANKIKPSFQQVEWRSKQILMGQSTVGFKNCCRKYPDYVKLVDKIPNNLKTKLVLTPTPNEEIGKKRWIGKYQKWRKFLHQFDTDHKQLFPSTL